MTTVLAAHVSTQNTLGMYSRYGVHACLSFISTASKEPAVYGSVLMLCSGGEHNKQKFLYSLNQTACLPASSCTNMPGSRN